MKPELLCPVFFLMRLINTCRRGFRINGDRFPPETTSAEGANYRGLRPCFPRKCSGFAVTLLSPRSWVSESF